MAEAAPNAPLTSSERRAYLLGKRSFERGDDAEALRQLRSFLSTRRGFADVHYMVGVLYERRDEIEEATRSLSQALRINPGYTEALLALASSDHSSASRTPQRFSHQASTPTAKPSAISR